MSAARRASAVVLVVLAAAGARADGPAPAAAVAPAPTLTVVVGGIAESRGELLVTAFASRDGWPKPARAAARARVPARAPETEVRLEGLPPGPCAVSVVQDLDGDGKLTMRWLPYPHPGEPTGASNAARGRFGPPAFEDARFDLPPGGATVRVTLTR